MKLKTFVPYFDDIADMAKKCNAKGLKITKQALYYSLNNDKDVQPDRAKFLASIIKEQALKAIEFADTVLEAQ